MGYAGSEHTTRRAVARLKAAYRAGRRRVFRPWAEPGLAVHHIRISGDQRHLISSHDPNTKPTHGAGPATPGLGEAGQERSSPAPDPEESTLKPSSRRYAPACLRGTGHSFHGSGSRSRQANDNTSLTC